MEAGHHPCNLQNIVSVMFILYSATPSSTFLYLFSFFFCTGVADRDPRAWLVGGWVGEATDGIVP